MASAPEKTKKRRVPRHEREMEVMEHLSELRARLFRALAIIFVASCIVWFYFNPLYDYFSAPIKPFLTKVGGQIVVTNWLEPFFIRMKMAAYGGIIISAPFWIMELWGFIAPALTPEERKPIRFLAPFTVVLFVMGVFLAHLVLPMAFKWAFGYYNSDVHLMQHMTNYIEFLAKMYLAFGLSFQLPVVLIFLAKVGLIDAPLMRRYWRQAVMVIMIFAAVITPSNDPPTMLMCAIPMAVLYLLSIVLVEKMG